MAVRRVYSEGEVRSFLLQECNFGSTFYSSEIRQRRSDSCRTVSFDCVLERRRGELVDASLILEIASVEVLVGVVTALVNCSTWTHAKFQFGCGGLDTGEESSELAVFERRMFEVYHVLGSSPSLLCLDISCGTNFPAFAEAVAGGVSRNSALKSLTLGTSNYCFGQHREVEKSLEVLFTSVSMTSVKELVLSFPNTCLTYGFCVANLVRWNTTLEKLTLCSTHPTSTVKDVTYTWTLENHGRALQVEYSGMYLFNSAGIIDHLTSRFSLNCSPDGIISPGTNISTLNLILSLDHLGISYIRNLVRPSEWVQKFIVNMRWLVSSVASMSAQSATLKHVQVRFEWGREVYDLMCSCRKQVELLTQKRLLEMVGNELGGNTSLETLEVGFWKLIRRGQHVGGGIDEWHMSYGGPCLSSRNEYVVEVQM